MIYYFDDARDGVREDSMDTRFLDSQKYSEFFKSFSEIPGDPSSLEELFKGDDKGIVFFHDSMPNSRNLNDWINRFKPSLALIKFSGGLRNKYMPSNRNYADYWTMKKDEFYRHLEAFLQAYERGEASLEHYLEYQLVDEQPEVSISYAVIDKSAIEPVDMIKPQEIEAFIKKLLDGNEAVMFDLDSLRPETVKYLSTYIRLSVHTLRHGALVPFAYAGVQTFNHYLETYRKSMAHEPLLWVGSYFVEKKGDKPVLTTALRCLTPAEYLNDFMNNLKIKPNGRVGNHSIANYWGAYVIARHLKDAQIMANQIFQKALDKDALYLKYIMVDRIRSVEELNSVLEAKFNQQVKNIEPIKAENTKILLVDDQDEIWKDVIKALIPKAELEVIGKSNGRVSDVEADGFLTPDAKEILEKAEDNFDLILLDLRLGGMVEEEKVNGDDCSGMKILKQLTDRNPGQQVIMFTSSNKAWNLKKALTMAAGYYIKESPLQPFSEKETRKNLEQFKTTIQSCLHYKNLRTIVKEIISLENTIEFPNFYQDADENTNEVRQQLGIVKTMAISQSRETGENGEGWKFVYLALFQVLEIIKRLSHNFIKKDKGNRNGDEKQQLVDLIKDVLLYTELSDKNEKIGDKENELKSHNKKRGDVVHRNPNSSATYTDFVDLWKLVKEILNATIKKEQK